MRVELARDADEFAARAECFLAERIERNVLATVLFNTRTAPTALAREPLLVWDDGGAVSLVSLSPLIAGVRRIGPVYTPPAGRRHGYASSAVAAAARLALAQGAERCALFTDLANPTSNRIYADVGFRRLADFEEHRPRAGQ
jgi:predicted GNAT family acetyltransferase